MTRPAQPVAWRGPLRRGLLEEEGQAVPTKSETLKTATNPPSREQLLSEVALEIQAIGQQRKNPLSGYKPTRDRSPGEQVLEELTAVQAIAAKATPVEAAAFGRWLLTVAQAAADAAKDGGFMGFGAQQVSEREQAMLDRVRAAVPV